MRLDAEVVGHDAAGAAARAGHRVGLGGAHLGDEVHAVGAGLSRAAACLQRRLVGRAERAGHGAGVADVAGEPAGVDATDAGDAVAPQVAVEVAVAAPVAAAPRQLPHDHPAAERPAALVVGRGHAVVADVGVGEGDDLPGVGRVRDHLLVAGEDGVEHHLPGRDPAGRLGPDRLALERRPVGQDQQRLPDAHGPPPRRSLHACHARQVHRTWGLGGSSLGLGVDDDRFAPEDGVADPAGEACGRRRGCCGCGWPSGSGRRSRWRWGRSRRGWRRRPRPPGRRGGRRGRRCGPAARTGGRGPARSGRSSSVRASASAVSSPSIPGGAWSKACSLSSWVWGAWSVAMAVEGAVGQTGPHRGDVGVGAQWRVDLEHRVVARALGVGEREVVGGRLGGHPEAVGPGGPHELDGAGGREVLQVDAGARETGQGQVPGDHELLGLGRLARRCRAAPTTGPRACARHRTARRLRSAGRGRPGTGARPRTPSPAA